MQRERYAENGTITLRGKLVHASGVLGHFKSEEDAELAGMDSDRAWVDAHTSTHHLLRRFRNAVSQAEWCRLPPAHEAAFEHPQDAVACPKKSPIH